MSAATGAGGPASVSIFDDPLAEPTERVRGRFIAILALANLGIWTAFFTPIQFLLPLQVEGLVGSGSKETNLSLVLTVGAMISLVASPIAGAFSDRTSSRLGPGAADPQRVVCRHHGDRLSVAPAGDRVTGAS